MSNEKLPAEVLAALVKDSLIGGHAVLIAVAWIREDEFWMVAMGRPRVLPASPTVTHFDARRERKFRYQDVSACEIPSGLEWGPYNPTECPQVPVVQKPAVQCACIYQ